MNDVIFTIALVFVIIIQFGFIHRWLWCRRKEYEGCENTWCDHWGNGECPKLK